MPPLQNSPTQPNSAVIVEKIEHLSQDVCELNDTVKENLKEQVEFRIQYAKGHAELVTQVEDHEERIEKLEQLCADLKDAIAPLIFANKAVMFTGSVLMVSIIGLIIAILTHQVQLGF